MTRYSNLWIAHIEGNLGGMSTIQDMALKLFLLRVQVLLLRMRQACIHPYLAQSRLEEPTLSEDALPDNIQAAGQHCYQKQPIIP